jgi:hypothetical protein
MDYGFTLISVTMLFLNHSGAVAIRFTLLDNRAVTIAVPITVVAPAPTGPTRTPTSSARAGVAMAATVAMIKAYLIRISSNVNL